MRYINWFDANENGQYLLNNVDGNFALRCEVEPMLNSISSLTTQLDILKRENSELKRKNSLLTHEPTEVCHRCRTNIPEISYCVKCASTLVSLSISR